MTIALPTSWQEIARSLGSKYDKIVEIINAINNSNWQEPVLDRLAAPPAHVDGERYLIVATASGDWTGKEDQIAESDGSAWSYFTPDEGVLLWVEDEDTYYQFTTSWAPWFNQAVTTTSSPTLNAIRFDISPTITPAEGDLYWNPTDHTLNIKTETETVLQIGQEQLVRGINNTGSTLTNGTVVFISGADAARPELTEANADAWETSQTTIGIVTSDITNGASGYATTLGLVRDLDTSGFSEGDTIYLDTTDGQFIASPPAHPAFTIRLGYIISVDASDGVIFFDIDHDRNPHYFNGSFIESFDATIASNGTTITMSIERSGTGDLTMRFSDGYTTLDTTPASTIALTAGTDTVPQANYIYIPKSTKVLTKSTTGFPTASEHIKIAYCYVQSASEVQTNGALINQNWNDHGADTNAQGHQTHLGERIRREGAVYFSGIDGAGVDNYLTVSAGNAHFKSASGVVYQMHRHAFGAIDQSTSDIIYIINDSVTPFLGSTNLDIDVTADNTGAAIGNNKYFNLVFWGSANKTGEYELVLCNLPGGFYNTQSDCENDVSGYDVLSMPREFSIESSTGFLICRITIQMAATWTVVSTRDLRGSTPTTVSGGGAGIALTKFLDSLFDIHNLTDSTKIAEFDASSISTATTRTYVLPDANGTIALLSDKYTDAEAVAAVEAAGLSLASTKVIVSADEDLTFTFGRGAIHSIAADVATFSHRDNTGAGNWAFYQSAAGETRINAKSGQIIKFSIADGGTNYMQFTAGDDLDFVGNSVITSADGDTTWQFGRNALGSPTSDEATLAHIDNLNTTDYMIKQLTSGQTEVNAKTGFPVVININDVQKAVITASGLRLGTSGAFCTVIHDEDDMSTDSATALATQQSIKAYADVANMIGSGNAAYAPCIFEGANIVGQATYRVGAGEILVQGATNSSWGFKLTIPLVKGGLSFTATNVRINLDDADGSNYIDQVRVVGTDHDTQNFFYNSTANLTSAAEWFSGDGTMSAFSSQDCSTFRNVTVYIGIVQATNDLLDLMSVELEGYYS